MKNLHSVTGTLNVVKRLPSSVTGNPRYLVEIAGNEYKTGPDFQIGYSVTNHNGKQVTAEVGTHYNVATLLDIL